MLAELVDHVIGVDPDRDWITVAQSRHEHRESWPPNGSRRLMTAIAALCSGPTRTAWRRSGRGSSRARPAMDAVSAFSFSVAANGSSSSTGPSAKPPRTAPSLTPLMPSGPLARRSDVSVSLSPEFDGGRVKVLVERGVTGCVVTTFRRFDLATDVGPAIGASGLDVQVSGVLRGRLWRGRRRWRSSRWRLRRPSASCSDSASRHHDARLCGEGGGFVVPTLRGANTDSRSKVPGRGVAPSQNAADPVKLALRVSVGM